MLSVVFYHCRLLPHVSQASFCSRMSHSCQPNCQAVVMAAAGRLTVAMYTTRHIQEGEELTFDYSAVTESEKEFRAATCLCGTHSVHTCVQYGSSLRVCYWTDTAVGLHSCVLVHHCRMC